MRDYTYLITGMGRSGTSFLAQSLKRNGVYIGKDFYPDMGAKGGYENKEFVNLNKKVFTEAGMGWGINSMPADKERLKKAFKNHKDEYKKLIDKHKRPVWGVKEPRISLFASEFVELLDDDPFIYIAIRKPEKVAESIAKLKEKNSKTPYKKDYLKTAKEYNRRIIDFIKEFCDL